MSGRDAPAFSVGRVLQRVTVVLASVFVVSSMIWSASATTVGPPACTNTATLLGSAFEIDTDANLIVNTSNCIDWLTGGTGTSFRSGVVAKNDQPTGSGDDSFGQGTAENNPNPTIVSGSIPPNKSDLKAFGVYQEAGEVTAGNPTGKFLELFWSRVQNPSGTTNMDFELNQNLCDGTATLCANNGTAKNPVYVTPKRLAGDKLITYDLSKGGTVPSISIRTWSGSAWGAATVISGGQNALARGSINTSTIPANQTGGVSGGLTASLGSQDPFTFGEASIAFSALFGTTTCGAFGSAYLKSRSSDSFTAEIKDFVAPEGVSIANCASITTNATASVTVGDPISDTATLSGVTANAGGTITFHLFSDATCTTEVNTGLTPVTVSGPNDYNSGDYTTTAVGTFYWIASYSGDGSNSPATTECGDANESSVVNKASSSISTAQNLLPNDTATVTPSGATGTVDFKLFGPGNATCDPSGDAPVYSESDVALSGGTASTSNIATTVSTEGTYRWLIEYSGDATHDGSTSACGVEAFTLDNDTTN
jgi:hypothetical protein